MTDFNGGYPSPDPQQPGHQAPQPAPTPHQPPVPQPGQPFFDNQPPHAAPPQPTAYEQPAQQYSQPVTLGDENDQQLATAPAPAEHDETRARILAIRDEVSKVLVGQKGVLSGVMTSMLANGHVLLEGVPGVAKTLMVKSLAEALDVEFARIQFTPDLMPSDIVGQSILDNDAGGFRFREGPAFTNLLLADEINRTPPKTQSALLEAMEERQVSVEGQRRPLPEPFMVIATQNPVEYDGTYPLPEAQLDRFMFKLIVGYPEQSEEVEVLARHNSGLNLHATGGLGLNAVASPADLVDAQAKARSVHTEQVIFDYIVALCRATREAPSVQLGVSPRGATALLHASKAWAWLLGKEFVTADEVKAMAKPVLRHRIMVRPELELDGARSDTVLDNILSSVPAPR